MEQEKAVAARAPFPTCLIHSHVTQDRMIPSLILVSDILWFPFAHPESHQEQGGFSSNTVSHTGQKVKALSFPQLPAVTLNTLCDKNLL